MRQLRFNLKTLFWLTAVVSAFCGGRELGIREERDDRTDPVLVQRTRLRDDYMELLRKASKRSDEARKRRAEGARRREAMMAELLRRSKMMADAKEQQN